MTPAAILLALLGLVALATALGLLWRARTGRAVLGSGEVVAVDELGAVDARLGRSATLLQFSSEVCAPCRVTHGVLSRIAATRDDVTHLDLDITHRPQLASRFHILQTPTTLVLDRGGVVRARIGGAARPEVVAAELERIIG